MRTVQIEFDFRGKLLAPQVESFANGINNCETTIRKLLDTKESIENMANYVPIMMKSKTLHGLFARSKKSTVGKATNKNETEMNKKDRLIRDKKFLWKLTRVETLVPSKRQDSIKYETLYK